MTDVALELLERLQEAFERKYENDERVGALFYLTNGFDTASEAMNDYAAVVGDILAETFAEELSSEDLPDGRMYWNIAERVVNPMLQNNYELITQACEQAITTLNEHAGIGIKPIIPAMDQDRIRGIDNMLANAERYDDVAPRFREAVVNYSQSVATDAVRENADFQYRAGMDPKIIREAEATACEWCQEVAGTYNYHDVRDTGNDVYRRHENCRCRVMYEPRRGSGRQNVHSKRWDTRTDEERAQLRAIGKELQRGAPADNINSRKMSMGMRRPPSHILSKEEVEQVVSDANAIGIPEQLLRINQGAQTGYSDFEQVIYVRGDVLPDASSHVARDRMSQRAVLAHEYYGHYMNHPSEYEMGDWRDEFRASRDAAIHAPGLTDEDRALLMIDAYDRAREAGVVLEYSEEDRKIIYGY